LQVQYVREVGAGKRLLLADAALLLVTIIWGATFVMVKDAISAFPVFSFMAVRFVLAALTLTPLGGCGG
jgi:drug/metabolite transporter (DMT)-like permease